MKSHNCFLVLLLLFSINFAVAQNTFRKNSQNKHFSTRQEYILCIFERLRLNLLDEDILVAFNVKSTDDKIEYKAVVGIKELSHFLYPNVNPSLEFLYFSIGKMLMNDTVHLTSAQIKKFRKNIISESDLRKRYKATFGKNKNDIANDNYYFNNDKALVYYFDRLFYPTIDLSDGYKLLLNFSFIENKISISENGKVKIYTFDTDGTLLNISDP